MSADIEKLLSSTVQPFHLINASDASRQEYVSALQVKEIDEQLSRIAPYIPAYTLASYRSVRTSIRKSILYPFRN